MIVANLANVISLLGVLVVALLFVEDGYRYVIPLLILNNALDDLDGIVANQLNIKSEFGAALDNVCDAVAHVVFVLVVGVHYGWGCGAFALVAAGAVLIRLVSRLVPGRAAGGGTPTNELMRHMVLVLLLARVYTFEVPAVLMAVFALNTVSMLLPYRLPGLIRGLAKSPFAVGLVNLALVVAWLVPLAAPVVALAFGATYLSGLAVGSARALRTAPSPE